MYETFKLLVGGFTTLLVLCVVFSSGYAYAIRNEKSIIRYNELLQMEHESNLDMMDLLKKIQGVCNAD